MSHASQTPTGAGSRVSGRTETARLVPQSANPGRPAHTRSEELRRPDAAAGGVGMRLGTGGGWEKEVRTKARAV